MSGELIIHIKTCYNSLWVNLVVHTVMAFYNCLAHEANEVTLHRVICIHC